MKFCRILAPDLSCRVYSELTEVPEEWDDFLPFNHFLKKDRLSVMEKSHLKDAIFNYLMIFREDRCIGVVYLQHFEFRPEYFNPALLGGKGFNFLEKILLHHQSGILICGNLFHLEGKGFYFENPGDESLIFQILNHYEKRAATKASLILIKDAGVVFEESIPEEYRYRKFEKDWLMEVAIQPEWQDFDAYFGSLSKKYRQRAAKILAAREPLEVRFLSLEEISSMQDRIEVLYQNVRQKQTFRPGELNALYFLNMKKNLGNDFQILAYFHEGEMVAFSSHIRHSGNRLEVHYIGIDYTLNEKYCLYFNILFDGIRVAIENRNSKLLLGRTGYDAKASAGAVPVAGQHFLRLKRGIPSLGFRYFSSNLAGSENMDWQKRSPFKESSVRQEPNLV